MQQPLDLDDTYMYFTCTCRSPEASKRETSSKYSDDKAIGEEEREVVVKEVAARAKQVHIDQLTALCRDIQKKQEREDEGGEVSEPEVSRGTMTTPWIGT